MRCQEEDRQEADDGPDDQRDPGTDAHGGTYTSSTTCADHGGERHDRGPLLDPHRSNALRRAADPADVARGHPDHDA